MSYTRFKIASFGQLNSGLATVGYALFNADGTTNGSRITSGILERGTGSGVYAATVTYPDSFIGEIRWDTGTVTPLYASEDINPSPFEKGQIDMAQSVPLSNTVNTTGDSLHSSRVDAFGNWVLDRTAKTLTLYEADGLAPAHTFSLDNADTPLIRISV